jgi:hypothetical protein
LAKKVLAVASRQFTFSLFLFQEGILNKNNMTVVSHPTSLFPVSLIEDKIEMSAFWHK